MTIPNITTFSIEEKEQNALQMLKHFYLHDPSPFCVAYSGGKDSSVILYLTIKILENFALEGEKLTKRVLIINSNTLAELPLVLKHYSKQFNLPVEVREVIPEEKNTLNVQLLGVGMLPPSNQLR